MENPVNTRERPFAEGDRRISFTLRAESETGQSHDLSEYIVERFEKCTVRPLAVKHISDEEAAANGERAMLIQIYGEDDSGHMLKEVEVVLPNLRMSKFQPIFDDNAMWEVKFVRRDLESERVTEHPAVDEDADAEAADDDASDADAPSAEDNEAHDAEAADAETADAEDHNTEARDTDAHDAEAADAENHAKDGADEA